VPWLCLAKTPMCHIAIEIQVQLVNSWFCSHSHVCSVAHLECSSCVNVWCQLSLAFHFALRSSCVPRWRRYISTQSQYTVQIALIANLKESRHPRRCRSVALTMTSLSHCQFLAQVLAASRGLKPNRLRNQFVSHMSSNFKLQTSVVVDFRSKSCSEQTGLGSLVSCSLFTVLFLFV
jgi:hypothetical protein